MASEVIDCQERQALSQLASALLSQLDSQQSEDTPLCLDASTRLADLKETSWTVFRLLDVRDSSKEMDRGDACYHCCWVLPPVAKFCLHWGGGGAEPLLRGLPPPPPVNMLDKSLLDVDPREWLEKPVTEWENEEGFVAYTEENLQETFGRRGGAHFTNFLNKKKTNRILLSYVLTNLKQTCLSKSCLDFVKN